MRIPAAVTQLIEGGPVAHVVTLNADGSPHVSLAWVGIEDDEVVIGTIPDQAKLRNLRRDPRVAISMVNGERNAHGLDEVRGAPRARSTDGGWRSRAAPAARAHLPRP